MHASTLHANFAAPRALGAASQRSARAAARRLARPLPQRSAGVVFATVAKEPAKKQAAASVSKSKNLELSELTAIGPLDGCDMLGN